MQGGSPEDSQSALPSASGPHAPTLLRAPDSSWGKVTGRGFAAGEKFTVAQLPLEGGTPACRGGAGLSGTKWGLTTASSRHSWAQLDKVNGEARPVRTALEAWGRGCLVAWPCTWRLGQGNWLVEWAWAG